VTLDGSSAAAGGPASNVARSKQKTYR